ncbi:MAG: hypothetical protein WC216_02995 [Gallionella sp.]|jgi:hypothetical protein
MPNDFFQFPHPGGEPPVNFIKNGICPANNTGSHFRKFLRADKGRYVTPNNSQDTKDWGHKNDARFTFWGEWELSSSVTFPSNFHQRPRALNYKDLPFQLHTPLLSSLASPPVLPKTPTMCGSLARLCGSANAMSTDPFVFCEPLLYYHCKIHTFTCLSKLRRGDIVVFGSKLAGNFVVDTVFVVDDWVSVQDPSLCGLFKQANGAYFLKDKLVCRGASFANPVDGMFSFFPALPFAAGGTPQPFRRPTLNLPSLINHNHGRGLRIKHNQNSKAVWQEIVTQIMKQNLILGLRA